MYSEGQKVEKEFAIVIDLRLTLLTAYDNCTSFESLGYVCTFHLDRTYLVSCGLM